MEKKQKALTATIIALSVGLGSICIALSIILIGFVSKSNLYGTQLENLYRRSFYELTQNVNDIELDISKLVATTSQNSQQKLLTTTYNDCVKAGENLSSLPIKSEKVIGFYYTVNRIGGYIYSLLENVNDNQELTENHYVKLEELHDVALELMWDINQYTSNLSIDYEIVKSVDFENPDNNEFTAGIDENMGQSDDVPTLIYDGPFSDSVLNKEIKGLGSDEYTEEEARVVLEEKLDNAYQVNKITYQGETTGDIATYNYQVETQNYNFYVQITKIGAFILNISGYGEGSQKTISEDEAEVIASSFASAMGVINMTSVWVSVDDHVYYVNLAYTQNDIIYYPDLIKVKIDKDSGIVVGYEATNYATNHVERTTSSPSISVSVAQENVSSALTIKDTRLAVIPNEFVGETLCYEFVCTWKEYDYYIYINATDGTEENIMRVIVTTHGNLIL